MTIEMRNNPVGDISNFSTAVHEMKQRYEKVKNKSFHVYFVYFLTQIYKKIRYLPNRI